MKMEKKRILEIFKNKIEAENQEDLPSENQITFSNGFQCFVTSVFVDIRDSTTLFSQSNKSVVAKVIRAFTSEIIEILRDDENCEDIGIRGDCIFAIYSTPNQADIHEVVDKCVWVNTYMNMLNSLLSQYGYPNIEVGIGISTSKELVVKAGRKDVGINDKVWIGKAVTWASKFSGMGNKNGLPPIVMSNMTYTNSIDLMKNINSCQEDWFDEYNHREYGRIYTANIVKSEFSNWINGGMQ